MKIKQAIDEAENGFFSPVYLLKGDDHFLQSFFVERIANIFSGDHPIDKILMLPDEIKGKKIIQNLTIIDLFSIKKIFIIRDPQRITGKSSKDLLHLCNNLNSNYLLFLIVDDWSTKSSFISKIEKLTEPINVQTPFDKDLYKWANFLIKEQGKYADTLILKKLVSLTGDSLGHLNNEINKISIFIGNRKTIELNDLEKVSGWKKEKKLWEFLLALGFRRFDESIYIGKMLTEFHGTLIPLIYPLTNFYQEMLFIKLQNGTFYNDNSYIALPVTIKNKIKQFSNRYTKEKLKIAIKILHQIDKKIKTQNVNNETELIQFIGRVIG